MSKGEQRETWSCDQRKNVDAVDDFWQVLAVVEVYELKAKDLQAGVSNGDLQMRRATHVRQADPGDKVEKVVDVVRVSVLELGVHEYFPEADLSHVLPRQLREGYPVPELLFQRDDRKVLETALAGGVGVRRADAGRVGRSVIRSGGGRVRGAEVIWSCWKMFRCRLRGVVE